MKSKKKKFWYKLRRRRPQPAVVGFWFGIVLVIISASYIWYQRRVLSFHVVPASFDDQAEFRQPQPATIKIAKLGLELPVTETWIENGVWQIADGQVSHLNTSSRPGENSNIVMYSHNQQHLFGKLSWLEPEDEIVVENEAGLARTYLVKQKQVVTPNDIQLVLPTNHELLTLYTCTGFLDQQRLVVQAEPIN